MKKEQSKTKISENIRFLRQKSNLTQKQLADALQIAPSAVSMYERGEREPDFETIILISDFFDVDIDSLVKRSIFSSLSEKHCESESKENQSASSITIAENIRFYRKRANLTQKQLAEKLGVKNSAVSNWENGQNFIGISVLPRLCHLLGITTDQIYGFNEEFTASDSETELLSLFNQMNETQKNDLLFYANNILTKSNDLIDSSKIGNYIKNYRISKNLSQRQFAAICGISNGYISMLEDGKNPRTNEPIIPSLSMLKKISSGMNIPINDFILLFC